MPFSKVWQDKDKKPVKARDLPLRKPTTKKEVEAEVDKFAASTFKSTANPIFGGDK